MDSPYGAEGSDTITHTTLGVTGTTQAALAANKSRRYALFINDSDAVIYIKLGAAAVLNEGIRLNAAGGSYEISERLGNMYMGAVNAITAAATKVLLVTEGV